MSRIQDILEKAERDGTVFRMVPMPFVDSNQWQSAPPSVMAPVAGSAALDPTPFLETGGEGRTASPTLHRTLVAAIDPHSPVAERYRAVRSRLAHGEYAASRRALMMTSPGPGEGKSLTAANLALTMAQEFQRSVVLVDADLRSPAIHGLFGIPVTPGLSDVVAGKATLDQALVYLPDYRLALLPAGTAPQFPTELLGSAAMRRTLDTLRARYDRILFDVPSVAPLADAGTVAQLCDAVVMVVRTGVTKRPALEQALGAFEDAQVAGVILNDGR